MELEELTTPEDEVEKSEHEANVEKSEHEDDDEESENEKNNNFPRSRSKTVQVKCGYQGCKAAPMLECERAQEQSDEGGRAENDSELLQQEKVRQ